MEKIEKVLDNFIEDSENLNKKNDKKINNKTVVINEREGLIERIDKQYVTSDGRILLREQY